MPIGISDTGHLFGAGPGTGQGKAEGYGVIARGQKEESDHRRMKGHWSS